MSEDFNRLRLKYHGDAEKLHDILQRECRHKCDKKLAYTLKELPLFVFPSVALAEMSTSDEVAEVQSSMVKPGERILDMTAGLGIDSLHFAMKGCNVTSIELDENAAEVLRNNLSSYKNVQVIHGDSVEWLKESRQHFDTIFIDPARRDSSGRHFLFSQCSPDISKSLPDMIAHCDRILVKASPMIDLKSAIRELGIDGCNVIVIGNSRECKEVVLDIRKDISDKPGIECITIGRKSYSRCNTDPDTCNNYRIPITGNILMQPFPAVMKGTGGNVDGYDKLHPFTHLYVADNLDVSFPGQQYIIKDVLPFNKENIRKFKNAYPKINVVARNFPLTAPELAKKLKVQEGGDTMVFGATVYDGSRVLVITGGPISLPDSH